jgi:hypothetical protein
MRLLFVVACSKRNVIEVASDWVQTVDDFLSTWPNCLAANLRD